MTVTVRPRRITQAEYDAVYHVVTSTVSRPPEGSSSTIAEITRADHSRLFVDCRRMTGGTMRYFLRDETLRAAAEAAGDDAVPLELGDRPVTMVSFGDADGDGTNDIFLRTADSPNDDDTDDEIYVIPSSGELGEIIATTDATEVPESGATAGAGAGGPTPSPRTANAEQIHGFDGATYNPGAAPPPPLGEDGSQLSGVVQASPPPANGSGTTGDLDPRGI